MATLYFESRDMTVGYRGVPLIRDIQIELQRGEILTLIGPNGGGKSTILKSIIRQLSLVSGVVLLDGKSMARMKEKDISQKLSVLMTERIRPELMTCYDVVATGRYPYTGKLGILSERDKKLVWEALETVHGRDLAACSFDEISDGQRQRILLARAICQEPEMIVLDEPTSFLDIRHKLELLSILKRMVRQRQVAVIMSLHELDLAQRISDKLLCVNGSQVDRCGTPEEIFAGDYIAKLYHIENGSYDPHFGSVELERVAGKPEIFVIGGGGFGIPVYRMLQRQGIPFAVGILSENDLDYPTAKALASEVISVPAFCSATEESYQAAKTLLDDCREVLCPLPDFGENRWNRALYRYAKEKTTGNH